MLGTHFNGKLTEISQREAGNTHYIWHTQADELVRNSHAPNHGQVFAWDNPPPTGHPGEDYNCRCTPIPFAPSALGIDDLPIEPSFIIEKLIIGGIIAKVANKAATAIGAAVAKIKKKKKPEEENPAPKQPEGEDADGRKPGQQAPEGGRKDTEWEFDKNKSETRWNNQKEKRGWTDEQITEAIKHGDAFPAINKRTGGNATRYEHNGKYVVRDNTTKDIIQISDADFIRPEIPK